MSNWLSSLATVAALVDRDGRHAAADRLARDFGAAALLVLLRDPETGVMLPAPGFPQTLPGGKEWRALAEQATKSGRAEAKVALVPGGYAHAVAFGAGADAAFVLFDVENEPDGIEWLETLMPLVVHALRGEQTSMLATAQLHLAYDEAARATALAATLDKTKQRLEAALFEARRHRAELEAKTRELEEVNELLSVQANRLEEQTLELEIQTDELTRTNTELEQARMVAENANRAKAEFLAAMSHELRTPLNAIGGHVQIMQLGLHGPVSSGQQEILERVDRNNRHLLSLINDILNFSRIEAGKVEYVMADLPVKEILLSIAPMIEPQMEAKGLTYTVRDVEDLTVHADFEKVQQILLNLLSNAVKFTARGGKVDLESGIDELNRVELRVIDSGVGIPREKLHTIFEPFTQVDASHSRIGHGVGLGLAISQDLAQGMNGGIRVESTVGRGSCFTLWLMSGSAATPGEPRDVEDSGHSRSGDRPNTPSGVIISR